VLASTLEAIVVAPNVAGSTGYGEALTLSIDQHWNSAWDDIVCLLELAHAAADDAGRRARALLTADGTFDLDRAALIGASFGGYTVAWALGHGAERFFRACVCHDGVFGMRAAPIDELFFAEWAWGGPYDGPESSAGRTMDRLEPAVHTAAWRVPTLVVQGLRDCRCADAEALGIFSALQRRGVPSRLLVFDKENHWVRDARNSTLWHAHLRHWLETHC
jgi:dipeptidyl aminopeptidase/acylaminoacyl peptidase